MLDKHKSIFTEGLGTFKSGKVPKGIGVKHKQMLLRYIAKNVLQNDTLLFHYDNNQQLVLACDASPYGLGVVLSHIMDDG